MTQAEQQWKELVEKRIKERFDLPELKNQDAHSKCLRETNFLMGVAFVESNLSQVPRVAELLEAANAVLMEVGYTGFANVSLNELEQALVKFKETK